MKLRLLDVLVCPECQGFLSLRVYRWEKIQLAHEALGHSRITGQICTRQCVYANGDVVGFETGNEPDCLACYTLEVLEGYLTCRDCKSKYPLIRGVPRMLPPSYWPLLRHSYPQFFKQYGVPNELENPGQNKTKVDNVLPEKLKTARSFSYQWTTFSTMYQEWRYNFLEYIHPIQPGFFTDKLVLDAGCGIGHHTYWSSNFGAETIAIDLSQAVDSARRNNLLMPMSHIVQADIYRLPFTAGTFDFIYSIGVLHHLPDPERGFRRLLDCLKPGGMVFAWVYGRRQGILPKIATVLRSVTTKLPFFLLKLLCYLFAVGFRLGFHLPYRALRRWQATKWLADTIPTTELSRYPFRVVVANIFDTLSVPIIYYYSAESFRQWFERAGLTDVKIVKRTTMFTSWRGSGTKQA